MIDRERLGPVADAVEAAEARLRPADAPPRMRARRHTPWPGAPPSVTDLVSALAAIGHERGVRAAFENRPDIGGRYSALSYFGLVAGALLGVDVDGLLDRAATVVDEDGLRLAAIIAGAAKAGRDKLT